jgi:pyroglutamyl-peptidase
MGRIALLTGFGPFGSYRRNPTEAVVRKLDGLQLDSVTIRGEVLPSSYARAPERVIEFVDSLCPEMVLALGYASRILRVRIETCGRNEKSNRYEVNCAPPRLTI